MKYLSYYIPGVPDISLLHIVDQPYMMVNIIQELDSGYYRCTDPHRLPLNGYLYNLLMTVRQLETPLSRKLSWYRVIGFIVITRQNAATTLNLFRVFRDTIPEQKTFGRGIPTAIGGPIQR